ncbi:MAG: PAS domain-containing protein [Fibrobacter sp.]|nr:PAS domain-containing protein [Fibrobacter sp.]
MRVSLKNQLIIIILAVTLFSTILAFSFSLVYDYKNSYNELKNSMGVMAQLIAESVKSPLLFNDTSGADELLSFFNSMPIVQQVLVLDSLDNEFTSFVRHQYDYDKEKLSDLYDNSYFDRNGLHITKPVVQENKFFGKLVMNVSTEKIKKKQNITVTIFVFVFLTIMFISYLIALKLQQIISKPVLELKDVAEYITHEADYSVVIQQTSQNEIGLLQASFNSMVLELDKNIKSLRHEIEDRKRSQQEAHNLRAYLKNMIDAISSVIIAVDSGWLIRQVNQEAINFFSRSSEDELLHKPVTEIITFLDEEEHLRNCLRDRLPRNFQVNYNKNENNQLSLNVSVYPLSQDQNSGIVILIDDVTEKTHMENMLIQNEKMMSLGGLAAGMAHEINNPLGIISQGVQNIMRRVSLEQQRNRDIAVELDINLDSLYQYLVNQKIIRYLEGILSASKRASEIVSNMLQFSRMSNQSKDYKNICEVIDQTIELARNEYELKKKFDFRQIKIIKDYDPRLPNLYCNVTEIQQVILNLLKNAAHALYDKNDEGFVPEISIRIKNSITHVQIEIEDNGPGIPQELKKRVFEPFFTTKEVGIGTGLGLSVSYFIITKNHSGTIDFESRAGEGTRFIIRIPFSS